ncbi:twin-arginine translocase TatA/TatE family subunit [Desulfolucanica intricata]|uniref:twin-arginine translocase TatA/TatE family subunit n=1 Tax=Desulfolucanica intricata TaxID=1285191 RepID=UPI0008332615|nr:twin-arginine translocase TatA/TatE family subunit [Desulfolucanica intricata]
MFNGLFQPTHLILILVVVLIIFGPGKLPEVGKAIGKGVRELRKATSEELSEKKEQPQCSEETGTSVAVVNTTNSTNVK